MKKEAQPRKRTSLAKAQPGGLAPLIAEVRSLIQSARHAAATAVNTLQVLTNFEIGRRIVEHEQKGAVRAGYGRELLKELSARLTEEFGKGFSVSNLQLMRKFFIENQTRIQQKPSVELVVSAIGQEATDQLAIPQKPSGELLSGDISRKLSDRSVGAGIWQTASAESPMQQKPSAKLAPSQILQMPSAEFTTSATPSRKSSNPFTLSWSHYVLLLTIQDPGERSFYEIEATSEGWSLPELKRQKASCLYERLALSRDKAGVKRLAEKGQIVTRPEDVLKEPLVLEFLGLDERADYSETELESALITHLEKFLLELGKGFLFEARQKRFTFDEDHYYLDLVFFNRLLRCYVVIDLKLDKLTHQDLGQMQMYVNYYDRHVRVPDENPTVGLLLCKEKKDAVVELTLPRDANIHAREYKLYLPSKALLKKKLLEWTREQESKA
jgi:predicted nuclease of restriction endonuclease-like (RecB) superfamily